MYALPARSLARDLKRMVRAISMMLWACAERQREAGVQRRAGRTHLSRSMLPECLTFFSFLRSRGGSRDAHKSASCVRYSAEARRRTLEGADDKGRGGGDDGADGLTVLDGELDGHAETLPVAGSLGDILSDLLGRLWRGVPSVVVAVERGCSSKQHPRKRPCGLPPVRTRPPSCPNLLPPSCVPPVRPLQLPSSNLPVSAS